MRRLTRLVAASALATAMAVGTTAFAAAPASAWERPQFATVLYFLNNVHVGSSVHYCEGPPDYWGDTTNFDRAEFYPTGIMCP